MTYSLPKSIRQIRRQTGLLQCMLWHTKSLFQISQLAVCTRLFPPCFAASPQHTQSTSSSNRLRRAKKSGHIQRISRYETGSKGLCRGKSCGRHRPGIVFFIFHAYGLPGHGGKPHLGSGSLALCFCTLSMNRFKNRPCNQRYHQQDKDQTNFTRDENAPVSFG